MPSDQNSQTPGKLLYAVDERPPEWMSALLGLQLVILVVAPITVTPLVVARMAGVGEEQIGWITFASLLASGISTFLQVRRFGKVGAGYVLFVGTSGAFIACSLAAAEVGGMPLVATMAVLSAPIQFLFGWFLGTLRHIVTPLVGGVVIMLIVVNVLGIALDLVQGGAGSEPAQNFAVSGITLFVILGVAVFGNARFRLWSPIIGIVVGTMAAAFYGMVDLSSMHRARWIGLPEGSWQGFSFDFGPEFFAIYFAFVLVTVVGAIETLGDSMAIQPVSMRRFRKVDYRSVQGAIYADGIGNALAGALGTLPNSTYSNAVAVVELTGVAARRVGLYGAGFLALLAFFPKVGALFNAIPSPVIGTFLFTLLAILFVTGMKLAASEGLNYESGIIIGISFWLGYAFQNQMVFPELIPATLKPFFDNGMVVGGISAILLSLLFNLRPSGRARCSLPREASELVRLQSFVDEYASARRLSPEQHHRLHLTAEELFLHLCESTETTTPVTIILHREADALVVEFIDRSTTADIDIAVETLGEKAEPAHPEELGLLLLGNFAEDIRHLTIGGINYISYRLPAAQ